MTTYKLADLEAAQLELAAWNKRFEDYTGNNPNKYQADLKSAREKVRDIEFALKEGGVLPKTESERLASILDQLFPNARSREIVEYQGAKYQRKFSPLEWSRSRKSVTAWERSWSKLQE